MLAESRDEGLIGAEELERLTGALELVQRPVGELMVPRDRLVAVDRSEGVDDIERLVESSGRSRIIVFDGDLDHIIGFVHAKDLLQVGEESRSIPIPIPLRRHVTVDAMAPLGEVIVEMQTRQIHMAVVSGARTLGIVTLEDILESIVGDIFDETDREAS